MTSPSATPLPNGPLLAHAPPRGAGPLVLLLPGAGDVRSEQRFLEAALVEAGLRVVSADLPGHGDSPLADRYGVREAAEALIALLQHLGEPAVVVGCSFSPVAAVWAGAEHPEWIRGVVAISPHFSADTSLRGRLMTSLTRTLLRGPWAAGIWASLYRGWYKARPPADLENELSAMRLMLTDPPRRRAVRETLTAHRDGVAERMAALSTPALVIFGAADDHFPDPATEAREVADRLRAEHVMVEGAGHYPHVERPDLVAPAVIAFVRSLPS